MLFSRALWVPFAFTSTLTAAQAQTLDDLDPDEAPPPPVELQFVPARYSIDGGVHVSYGMLPQFAGAQPWVGIGGRFAWGRNWTNHRLGFGVALSFEGPLGVEWANNIEPGIQWDWVNPKGFYFGATLGPALILNASLRETTGYDTTFDVAPFVAMRIGWSQRFSLIARRFFLAVEPKLRIVDGRPGFVASLVFGAGRGY